MVGAQDGPVGKSQATVKTGGGSASDVTRWLTGILLVLVGIAAIIGGIMAFSQGLPALAFAIALIAGAFFARVAC